MTKEEIAKWVVEFRYSDLTEYEFYHQVMLLLNDMVLVRPTQFKKEKGGDCSNCKYQSCSTFKEPCFSCFKFHNHEPV